jgi:type II secretory pathway component PulK
VKRGDSKGIALILVVSILTVVTITVVSFIFTMRMENRAAANYLWQVKAGYIAEAGISHAWAILREDKENGCIDTHSDNWRSQFSGGDIDNNDDGTDDSRWIEMSSGGKTIGRYSVFVEDESSKININTAGFHNENPLKVTQGASPFEVSLENFLLAKEVSSAETLAGAIIDSRYGTDKSAGDKNTDDNGNLTAFGNDGIDNDADGKIDEAKEGTDEPQEFFPAHPFGDDQPFLTTEQIKRVEGVTPEIYDGIKNAISAYSQTASLNGERDLQWDINTIDAQQLLDVLFLSGVSLPWQKAVNIVDFVDPDFSQSAVVRSVRTTYATDTGPTGGWEWVEEDDYYRCNIPASAPGTWGWWGIPAGTYYLIMHSGAQGQNVGDVTLDGDICRHMKSGDVFFKPVTVVEESHPFYPQGGIGRLSFTIQNNEGFGQVCYFKYIELASAEGKMLGAPQQIKGVEGIRINEIMPKPTIEVVTTLSQAPGGHWIWHGGYYQNAEAAGGAVGEGTWLWENVPDGRYYLTVFAEADDQTVGDVTADGVVQENMKSGETFTEKTVRVSGGKFRLDIQNNLLSGNCYFKSAILSQQPDAEYIELLNLTPNEVSLGGWGVATGGSDGWPASIPLGTVIGPGEYLVLAVDKKDSCSGIENNGISFEDIWGKLPSVQLDFSRSVTDYSDMIDDTPQGGEGEVSLYDEYGNVVDTQQYSSSQITPYVSLEKGDPTCDGWFQSADLSGATPASENNNTGMQAAVPAEVKNRPLANLGEVTRVSSGEKWEKIGIEDLINLADRLTVNSLKLEAEGYKKEGGWQESLRAAPWTSWFRSQSAAETGTWLWGEEARIPQGVYSLYLYGNKDEAISISLHLADDSWTDFSPPLAPGANNSVCFGRVEIGTGTVGSLPAGEVEMRVKNVSASNTAHFDCVILAPLPYVAGKVNINTAPVEILQALPKLDQAAAERIISSRPLGNKDEKGHGIGDILDGSILNGDEAEKIDKFSAISNLISVRSDTYEIIATGQALRNGRVMAEKRIRAVIQR